MQPQQSDLSVPPFRPSQTGLVLAIIAWCVVGMISIFIPVMNEVSKRVMPPVAQGVDVGFQTQGQYVLGAARAFESEKQTLLDQFADTAKSDDAKRAAAKVVRDVAIAPADPVDLPEIKDFGARFPWFSQLADLETRDAAAAKADRVFGRAIILIITGLGVAALALAMGILAIILLATGKLRFPGVRPDAPAGLYIEAFAIWLVMYLMGSIAVEAVMRGSGSLVIRMVPLVLAFTIAIAWPTIRGARWGVVRRDIGLHAGKGFFREIGAGVLGYLACLPLVAASLLFVLVMQRFVDQEPTHPIQQMIVNTNPLWIYLLAAVFAPVTEELVFRGLLLTHLRGKLGMWTSGLISGLIFAAIHPQGWVAIPTLMTIALVLALIREWRHSLIAPIVAHAINNGAVVTVMVLLMR
jgi:membrane protease YdiL (CAAX protease family)